MKKYGWLLLLGGAAAIGYHMSKVANAVQQLVVSLKKIRHASTDLTQSKFILTLSVYNPNNVTVSYKRFYAQVKVAGQLLSEVNMASPGGVNFLGLQTKDLEFPVFINHATAGLLIKDITKALLNKSRIDTVFDIQGTLYAGGLQLPVKAALKLSDLGINGTCSSCGVRGLDCLECSMR
jgi:LEA14-like dessication related protein